MAGWCPKPSPCCRRWHLRSERRNQSAQRIAEPDFAYQVIRRQHGFLRPSLRAQFGAQAALQHTGVQRRGQQHTAALDEDVAARPFGEFAALVAEDNLVGAQALTSSSYKSRQL